MAQIQICGMSIKRTGEVSYGLVQFQDRATVPKLGDLVEVLLNKEPVRGRVVHVASPPLEKQHAQYGVSYVDLDEVVGSE